MVIIFAILYVLFVTIIVCLLRKAEKEKIYVYPSMPSKDCLICKHCKKVSLGYYCECHTFVKLLRYCDDYVSKVDGSSMRIYFKDKLVSRQSWGKTIMNNEEIQEIRQVEP